MSAIDHLATIVLSTQVGVHAGELLIKPALPRELAFYQKLQSDEKLATLLPFVPKFLGTLILEGEVDDTKPQEGGVVLSFHGANKLDSLNCRAKGTELLFLLQEV